MVEHNGTISALEFFGTSHLITGSEDGKVALFRTKDWECLHVFLHKSPISAVAVHPSGKLALSVSAKSLRLWNLVTGKLASRSKPPKHVNKAVWSRTGKYYALVSEQAIYLHDAENGAQLKATLPGQTRILTAKFFNDSHMVYAGEGSLLYVYDIESTATRQLESGQKPRIKDMSVLYSSHADLLITAASEGSVFVWDLAKATSQDPVDPLVKHTTSGLRLICLTSCLQ